MLGAHLTLAQYLDTARRLLLKLDQEMVQRLADALFDAHQEDRFILLCGNGGNAANASHVCFDLSHTTLDSAPQDAGPRLRVLSLTDSPSSLLGWGDDDGLDFVFVEALKSVASPGDLLIAMSGTGRSPNILEAVDWANRNGLTTWGITGYCDDPLRKLAHHTLRVPIYDSGFVESIQLLLFHWLADDVHARISRFGRHAPDGTRNGAPLKLWPHGRFPNPPQKPRPA